MQRRSARNTGPATPAAEQPGQHPDGAGLLVRNYTNADSRIVPQGPVPGRLRSPGEAYNTTAWRTGPRERVAGSAQQGDVVARSGQHYVQQPARAFERLLLISEVVTRPE